MKIITVKSLPLWAKVAGLLALIYIGFFELPSLWATLRWTWRALHAANGPGYLIGITQLNLAIAGTAIWAMSVWLCGRALFFTRKTAYALLLAYLLTCTITTPLSYGSRQLAYALSQRQIATLPAEQQGYYVRHPLPKPTVAVEQHNLSLPVGPVLLLLAICFLFQADMRRDAKP